MKRSAFIVAILVLQFFNSLAAPIDAETREAVTQGALAIRAATLGGDSQATVELMHPRAIEIMGGKKMALQLVEKTKNQLAADGFEITKFEIGDFDSIYESSDSYHVFVPTMMELSGTSVLVRSEGYLLASRSIEGGDWGFIDGAGIKNSSVLEAIFPGFPGNAKIPPKSHTLVE